MGHPDPFLHLNAKLYHCIHVSLCIITHTFVSTGDNCFFCEINNSMLKFRNVKSTYTFSIRQIKVIIWDSLHCIVQQAEKNSFSPSKIVEVFWVDSWYTWRIWVLRLILPSPLQVWKELWDSETCCHMSTCGLLHVFYISDFRIIDKQEEILSVSKKV